MRYTIKQRWQWQAVCWKNILRKRERAMTNSDSDYTSVQVDVETNGGRG